MKEEVFQYNLHGDSVVHNKTKVKTKWKDEARPMKRSGIDTRITTAHDSTKYEIQDNGSWKRMST